MKDVNLTKIYLQLVKFYGVKRFEVFSDVDQKWLYPKETMIEFFMDGIRNVNLKRLNRILERDIKNVSNFFVVVDGNKITIHIDYAKKCKVEFDFEFSSN